MEDELDLPENKLRDFIQDTDKGKWRCDNNHNIKYFTEDEIISITSNYNTKLGNGSFGEVYRGVLLGGRSVAVKRYIRVNTEEEFAKEVIAHSQINHKNVVMLIGCCIEKNAQMMVFEHVTNGNLNDHLHQSDAVISLDTRLNIAIECAEALWCMHSMYKPVLHGDIKPSNILLDDSFHAKISDFGLSRLLSGGNTEWTINVKGSIGYMDPTFTREGRLTPKIDVYSFGVVLVELITKMKPTDKQKNIVKRFARFSAKEKAIRELFDVDIANVGSMKILEGIATIARECLKEKADDRPEMHDVAGRLRELRTALLQRKETAVDKMDQYERKNVSSSVINKIMSIGIFNNNAPNFVKIGSKILYNINNIMIFTKKEVKNITQNYSTLLYGGSYNEVYLGALADNTRVAVNKPKKITEDFKEMAVNELKIQFQSRMYHRNILKLLGCCLEMDIPVLVYEYAANGSLDKYLFVTAEKDGKASTDRRDGLQLLDLNMRYQIALGVARAMVHIHEQARLLHCGISPRSIFLDDHFCPKVTNFDLSEMMNKEEIMRSDGPRGTMGYAAPEWICEGELITATADVYSFGMVLLETISGRRNYERVQDLVCREDWHFPKWAYGVYLGHRVEEILDQRIFQAETYNNSMVECTVKTALLCLQNSAEMRPSMREVVGMLEGTLGIPKASITEPAKPIIFRRHPK